MLACPDCTKAASNTAHNIALCKRLALTVTIVDAHFKFCFIHSVETIGDLGFTLNTQARCIAIKLPFIR